MAISHTFNRMIILIVNFRGLKEIPKEIVE